MKQTNTCVSLYQNCVPYKPFYKLTVNEMKTEGFGVNNITPTQLESDKLFVDYQCQGGTK